MNIEVKVITNAVKQRVIKEYSGLKVYVNSSPTKGKANKELREVLSNYYNLPKSNINIVKGIKSRKKIVQIKQEFK